MTMSLRSDLKQFFETALDYARRLHAEELGIVEKRRFETQTDEDFLWQYAYVVLNAGMKNVVAEMFQRLCRDGPATVGHKGKRTAIEAAFRFKTQWFTQLSSFSTAEGKVFYLSTLPWIGPVTKYHLARNLGIDCAKPDRHLARLAVRFGYAQLISQQELNDGVQKMCKDLAAAFDMRVESVDLVLWRWCAEH